MSFQLIDERVSYGWRTEKTGKQRLRFLEQDPKAHYTSLPQRKDGTFDYARVAAGLVATARVEAEKTRQNIVQRELQPSVQEFRDRMDIQSSQFGSRGVWATPSTDPALPVVLTVRCTKLLSLADAEQVVRALRAVGIGAP